MMSRFAFKNYGFVGATVATAAAVAAIVSHAQAIAAGVNEVLGPLIASSCASSNPCLQWTNSSTGPGVAGISSKGKGISGTSTSGSGVSGRSSSGVGVRGASTTGAGVFGASSGTGEAVGGVSSGSGPALFGFSANGMGVQGESNTNIGVFARSSSNNGVFATSSNNDGINASTTNNSTTAKFGRSGIFAHDDSTDGGHLNVGVAGTSTSGIGVDGVSSNYVGVNAQGGFIDPANLHAFPALSVVGDISDGTEPDLIHACPTGTGSPCEVTNSVFTVAQSGDVFVKAELFANEVVTNGSCSSGCSRTNSSTETRVRFFTPRESLPTVEDFGEAQLVNGQTYVRIDPSFANTMDAGAEYMVFITPEGDSRGVYVTAKTSSGFIVRENQGGRSTLAFSYRIVAKPFGEHPVRLQTFTMAVPRIPTHKLLAPTYPLQR